VLQGTFETLSFAEVLHLLAASGKTGALHVVAGRCRAIVWVADGECRAVEHDGAHGDPGDVQLVQARLVHVGGAAARHRDGAFRFVDREAPPWATAEPVPLADALVAIDHEIARWAEVQRVVPALDLRPRLSPQLAAPELVLDEQRWRVLVAIDGERTVAEIGVATRRDDLAVCEAVAALVEAGAVVLQQPLGYQPAGRSSLAESPYGPGVDQPDPGLVAAPVTRGE
jgi:hypothetical protein